MTRQEAICLKVGQKVRITDGELKGMEGMITISGLPMTNEQYEKGISFVMVDTKEKGLWNYEMEPHQIEKM